jgi:hypothetical protein
MDKYDATRQYYEPEDANEISRYIFASIENTYEWMFGIGHDIDTCPWRIANYHQKPNRNRSRVVRLGARRRGRLMTRSCCFMSRLSATTARASPGPGVFRLW